MTDDKMAEADEWLTKSMCMEALVKARMFGIYAPARSVDP